MPCAGLALLSSDAAAAPALLLPLQVKEKPKSAFGRQVDALRATAMCAAPPLIPCPSPSFLRMRRRRLPLTCTHRRAGFDAAAAWGLGPATVAKLLTSRTLQRFGRPILDQVRSAGIFKKVGEMKQDLDDRSAGPPPWPAPKPRRFAPSSILVAASFNFRPPAARIETSEEGTMLHRLQGVREKARVSVTPRAEAEMLIKQREPDFDIHEFVATLKGQVPDLIASYLKVRTPRTPLTCSRNLRADNA